MTEIHPEAVVAERALLGAIIIEGDAAWSGVSVRLTAEDFSLERHRVLWGVCRDLVADEMAIDLVTVSTALRARALDAGMEAPESWLADLVAEAATLASLESYAVIVIRESARRHAIAQAHALLHRLAEVESDPVAALMAAGMTLTTIAQQALRHPPEAVTAPLIRDAVDEVMADVEAGRAPSIVPTPWGGLNRLLGGGLARSELTYLGGWTSMGKTAAAMEIARWAARHGQGVLVISREMSRRLLAQRVLAQEAEIDAIGLRRGMVEPGDAQRLRGALATVRALPLWISDTAASLADISALMQQDRTPRAALLIVDYLQLLTLPPGHRDVRHGIEALSAGLKALAIARDIPVLALSALSRPGDDHKRPPILSDLRETGRLESDADTVIFVHRPDRFVPEAELIVAKQRSGPVGRVAMTYRATSLRFTEISDRGEGARG